MKTVSKIAQILLGVIFTVFGLNGFLQFLPMGPVPEGPATQFFGALAQSHYMAAVFTIQLAGGLLLLANRFVTLALTVLGAVLLNILLFHIFMAPAGLPLALVTTALWVAAVLPVRAIFPGLLQQKNP